MLSGKALRFRQSAGGVQWINPEPPKPLPAMASGQFGCFPVSRVTTSEILSCRPPAFSYPAQPPASHSEQSVPAR